MRATLSFNLESEDDKYLYEIHLKAQNHQRLVEEWENLMRSKVKYGNEEESVLWDSIRDKYWELKNEIFD